MWTVIVTFYDDGDGRAEGPAVSNECRYTDRESADRAAIRLESRNMANGSTCSAKAAPLPLVLS